MFSKLEPRFVDPNRTIRVVGEFCFIEIFEKRTAKLIERLKIGCRDIFSSSFVKL
jgi:hypothetical protein